MGQCDFSWVDKGTSLNDIRFTAWHGATGVSHDWTTSWGGSTSGGGSWWFQLNDLTVGIHTASVTVTDDITLCETVLDFELTVEQVPCFITPICESVIDECDGDSSGSISLEENGVGPFSYTWSDGQTTNPATNLAAGLHTVTVTDADGCTGEVSCTVENLAAPSKQCRILEFNVPNWPTPNRWLSLGQCEFSWVDKGGGLNDVRLVAWHGAAGMTFNWSTSWTGATWGGTSWWFDLNDLTIGTYTASVTVTDDVTLCETVLDFEVTVEPDGCVLEPECEDIVDACPGANDGEIDIMDSGTPPIEYLWSDGQTTNPAIGLSAGLYSVTTTDSNGCVGFVSCEVGTSLTTACGCQNPILFVDYNIISNPTCGNFDGSVQLQIQGGDGPYSFSSTVGISGVLSENNDFFIEGLPNGDLTIYITDLYGCTFELLVRLTGTVLLIDDYTIVNTNCQGNNFSIYLNMQAGTPPFTYMWDNGDTNSYVENLSVSSSTYFGVTVSDNGGCIGEHVFLLDDLQIELLKGDPLCGENNGMVEAVAMTQHLGVPPFSYEWSTGDTTQRIEGLPPGNFTVTVTDASGCSDSSDVTLHNQNSIALAANGGDEGFSGGRYFPSGLTLDWIFDPRFVSDQIIITSSINDTLINTGSVTNVQEQYCGSTNCCSDYFLGDHAGETIDLIAGSGFVTPTSNGWASQHISGELTIANGEYIYVEVVGRTCNSGSTEWDFILSCSGTSIPFVGSTDFQYYDENDKPVVSTNNVDVLSSLFKLFPNPAKDNVVISSTGKVEYSIEFLDITGKSILNIMDIGLDNFQVDLGHMPSGMYIVVITSEGRRQLEKLVIE